MQDAPATPRPSTRSQLATLMLQADALNVMSQVHVEQGRVATERLVAELRAQHDRQRRHAAAVVSALKADRDVLRERCFVLERDAYLRNMPQKPPVRMSPMASLMRSLAARWRS